MKSITPEKENVVLKAENAMLRQQVTLLMGRVQELEAKLAKDCHNCSKTPSINRLVRKTESLRRRSVRKPGGQIGHNGETLRLMATPDEVVVSIAGRKWLLRHFGDSCRGQRRLAHRHFRCDRTGGMVPPVEPEYPLEDSISGREQL